VEDHLTGFVSGESSWLCPGVVFWLFFEDTTEKFPVNPNSNAVTGKMIMTAILTVLVIGIR
jgi:hypothetical protein